MVPLDKEYLERWIHTARSRCATSIMAITRAQRNLRSGSKGTLDAVRRAQSQLVQLGEHIEDLGEQLRDWGN